MASVAGYDHWLRPGGRVHRLAAHYTSLAALGCAANACGAHSTASMRALDFARALLGALTVAAGVLTGTACAAGQLHARFETQFTGSSTLHDFHGTAAPVTVVLEPEPSSAGRWSADVEVPVATLYTGIDARDEKMRAMLDATHFPVIRGVLHNIDPAALRTSGRLGLMLVIGSVQRNTVATIDDWHESDDEVRFDASFDVSLKAFDLKAPHVLFLRVADRVHVRVHATVRRDEGDADPSTSGKRS